MQDTTSSETIVGEETKFPRPPNQPRSPGWKGILFLCILTSFLSCAASIYVYDQYYAQKIVALDIKDFMEQKKAEFMAGRISEDDLRRSFGRIDQAIATIPKNKAIMMGYLVITNDVEVIKP